MKIRFNNARILKMNGEDIFLSNLVVVDNKIAYIGDEDKFAPYDKEIDCHGNLLMPGFKNAHAHNAMTFLRSEADDKKLEDWLFNYIFPREDKLQKGDVYNLSMIAYLEYLTSGITASFDMYFFNDEIAKSAKDFGMRTVICLTKRIDDEYTYEMARNDAIRFNNYDELVSFHLGNHSVYTPGEESLKAIAKLSHELKRPTYAHGNETATEVANCIKEHGCTPIEYMNKLGLFDYGGGVFHCVHMSDNDIKILKEKNVNVISCPGSNSKLSSGIAPITKMQKAGLNIALGTDGPSSNNALDMFREMYLCSVLQKLQENDPTAAKAEDVLKMATVNGAIAMGLNDATTLEVGKLADIIMIDLTRPCMQPITNIVNNLVYSGSKDVIKMTMINGKILYMDGVFYLNQDVNEIYRKGQEMVDRIRREMENEK